MNSSATLINIGGVGSCGLSDLLKKDQSRLAEQLWQNSCAALRVSWEYPIPNKLNINTYLFKHFIKNKLW